MSTTAPQVPTPRIQNAALGLLNDRIRTLVHAADQLDFTIAGTFDLTAKGLAPRLGPAVAANAPLASAEALLEEADTLILDRGEGTANEGLDPLLTQALDSGCHILDLAPGAQSSDYSRLAAERGLALPSPGLNSETVRQTIEESDPKLGPVEAPVLAVVSTSRRWDVLGVQRALGASLATLGYRVGQVSGENHAALLPTDIFLPLEYAAPLDLPLQYVAPYIDAQMRQFYQQQAPDIVLVGAPFGLLPNAPEDPDQHALKSMALLSGARPDACLLLVDYADEDAFLVDTVNTLKGLTQAPTALVAMGDLFQRDKDSFEALTGTLITAKLQALRSLLDMPATDLTDFSQMAESAQSVVRFFAG